MSSFFPSFLFFSFSIHFVLPRPSVFLSPCFSFLTLSSLNLSFTSFHQYMFSSFFFLSYLSLCFYLIFFILLIFLLTIIMTLLYSFLPSLCFPLHCDCVPLSYSPPHFLFMSFNSFHSQTSPPAFFLLCTLHLSCLSFPPLLSPSSTCVSSPFHVILSLHISSLYLSTLFIPSLHLLFSSSSV